MAWQRLIKDQNASPRKVLPDSKGIIVLYKKSVQIIDIDTGGMKDEINATDLSRGGR